MKTRKKLLSLILALAMLAVSPVCWGIGRAFAEDTAEAVETDDGIELRTEEIDPRSLRVPHLGQIDEEITAETEPIDPEKIVRVSIFLEGNATVDEGFDTRNFAHNTRAVAYRRSLELKQKTMQTKIEGTIGHDLDVEWNLTLLVNAISANVPYKDIASIESIPGVRSVEIERTYRIAEADTVQPNSAITSEHMVGASAAWAEGYTGAGSRIAIIDTGIDPTHQSFDADAFLHAIEEVRQSGRTVDLLGQLDNATLSQLNAKKKVSYLTPAQAYRSEKIPFGFNYGSSNLVIDHLSDTSGEHGSHVAGIAAANRYIKVGNAFKDAVEEVHAVGMAPDAQLIVLKVFGGWQMTESTYFSALEDALVLGCDAANLSLGYTEPGFSYDSTYQDKLDKLTSGAYGGMVVSISAGNAGAYPDELSTELYLTDVSMHTGGTPGTYNNSLCVASADNIGFSGKPLVTGECKFTYWETAFDHNPPLTTIADTYDYVYIDGIGDGPDYAEVNAAVSLVGKIVLINRGKPVIFADKGNNAIQYHPAAVLVVNTAFGALSMDLTDFTGDFPMAAIPLEAANAIKAGAVKHHTEHYDYYTGTITVPSESDPAISEISGTRDAATISAFSSWGIPGSLLMKPEITAPGGGIYSVFGTNLGKDGTVKGGSDQYENMSGTSMAAPHIAGLAAILSHYLRENPIGNDALTGNYSTRAILQSLLMSTATPMKNDGSYVSLLQQGAGLAEVGRAVDASSVIMIDDATLTVPTGMAADGKVKVELGDDPERTGTYTYAFTIYNTSDVDLAYDLRTDLFTQGIDGEFLSRKTTPLSANVRYTYAQQTAASHDVNRDGQTNAQDAQAVLDCLTGVNSGASFNLAAAEMDNDGKLTTYDAELLLQYQGAGTQGLIVPAHGSRQVMVDVQLDDAKLNNYPAGAYVQGFTYVTGTATDPEGRRYSEEHSIPILGYYGSWTDPSMFDNTSYIDTLYGTERVPYSGNTETNYMTITQNGVKERFTGNPYKIEETFPADRLAINTNTTVNEVYVNLIRNAGIIASAVSVTNGIDGTATAVKESAIKTRKEIGLYHDGEEWTRTATKKYELQANLGSYGLVDGDTIRVGLYALPEYDIMLASDDMSAVRLIYFSKSDFNSLLLENRLGTGAFIGYDFTVDTVAPAIGTVKLNGNTVNVSVSDNHSVAYVALRSADGNTVYADATPGTAQASISLDARTAIANGITNAVIFVGDYAGNEAATSVRVSRTVSDAARIDVVPEEEAFVEPEPSDTGNLSEEPLPTAGPANTEGPTAPELTDQPTAWPEPESEIVLHAFRGTYSGNVRSVNATTDASSQNETIVTLSETQATTNGMFTVTYDPQKLTFAEANGIEAYSSVNVDETSGMITIAYAAKQALAAGATVATIRFTAAGCTDESLTVTTTERGRELALHEVETVIVTGSGHLWGTPTYTWSSDNRTVTAKAVCRNNSAHTVVETVNTTSSITTPATCTTKGKTTYTATFTNTLFTAQTKTVQDIPALGHDLEHHAAKAPTCTEIGWNAYDTCSRCDYTTYQTLPALGHDLQHHNAKAPTCTEIGWNAYDTCSRCDYTTYQTLPAIGHSYGTPTYTWSSDNKTVTAKAVCRNNSAHTVVETVNTTNRVTTPATCTTKGKTTYTATFTNTLFTTQTKTVQDIPALGHDLEHHAAKAPTCTEIGWNAYDTCSRCDYTTYQTLPALGHNLQHHAAKAPTCTEIGWNAYDTCTRCDYTTYRELAALGHDLEHHAAKAPTCTEIGWNAYDTCSRCDYTTYQTLPALGHDLEHHAAKAPTCSESGWNAYDTCTRCDYTTYQELPAIGHSYGTPTYTWSSDNKTVTAKAVCRYDASHVKNETVQTTETVTQEAALGVPDVKTYTAEFTDALFATQTKTEEIPALPVSAGKPATVEVKAADVEFNGKTPYRVYNGKAQTPGYIVKDEKGNVIPASKYKAEYKENVKAGTAYIFITFPNKDYKDCRTFFKIYLPATTWTKVESVENGIKISWTKVEGAAGYVVYRRAWNLKDNGWTTFERWNNTTGTSWVDTKVYAGTRYQYGVKAYFARRADAVTGAMIGGNVGDNYNLGLVGPLKTTVRITTRVLNSVTPGSKKLTVKWTGSSLFTGYQVQVATDAKFTKDLKTVTVDKAGTYEKAVTGLKAKTTYYVRVRSYHIFEGMTYYGQWSNVLNAKTK